jgi:tetratricopeptide (TPR) repeat protein
LAVRFDSSPSPKEADLGTAYAALGRTELAEVHLERALDLDPLNLGAAELLIDLYEKIAEPAKAELLRNKIRDLIH